MLWHRANDHALISLMPVEVDPEAEPGVAIIASCYMKLQRYALIFVVGLIRVLAAMLMGTSACRCYLQAHFLEAFLVGFATTSTRRHIFFGQ